MKQYFGKFLIVAACLLFITCKKVYDVEIFSSGPIIYGKVTAKLNGKDWIAAAYAARGKHSIDSSLIGITATTRYIDTIDFRSESFGIGFIPNSTGLYKRFTNNGNLIKKGELMVGYGTVEHDSPLLHFSLDTTKSSNFVEITELDIFHIRGQFDLTFVAQGNKKIIYRFKDGQFDVKF